MLPDIGRGAVTRAQQDLQASVLSRLNVLREMMSLKSINDVIVVANLPVTSSNTQHHCYEDRRVLL